MLIAPIIGAPPLAEVENQALEPAGGKRKSNKREEETFHIAEGSMKAAGTGTCC
jgi:hypothetical protein